jgi:hypothetical protein
MLKRFCASWPPKLPGHKATGRHKQGADAAPPFTPVREHDVARQIRATLVKAGGEALAEAVYGRKARNGEAVLTRIHHRQTPLLLMQGLVDAGVTWKSEALFQEEIGNPISHVDIPEAQNTRAEYSATMVKDAPHPEAPIRRSLGALLRWSLLRRLRARPHNLRAAFQAGRSADHGARRNSVPRMYCC